MSRKRRHRRQGDGDQRRSPVPAAPTEGGGKAATPSQPGGEIPRQREMRGGRGPGATPERPLVTAHQATG